MRIRTMVAGATLAMLTAVLGAPAAYAAPDDDDDGTSQPTTSSQSAAPAQQPAPAAAPEPPNASVSVPNQVAAGATFDVTVDCGVDGAAAVLSASPGGISFTGHKGKVADGAAPGTYTVTLACTAPGGTDQASDTLQVTAAQQQPQPQQPVAPVWLSVAPDQAEPGQHVDIDFSCPPGPGTTTLTADPGVVDFDGDLKGGKIHDNAHEGDVKITLKCPNGDTETDVLRVREARRPYLDLDPNEGYRDDRVEVEAYCPGNADARLNSPVLDDITLKRDGDGILRGKTHVEHEAGFGDSFGEVLCGGGQKPSDHFRVLEHRGADLDLDPAFGKRGDEIKVYVTCDFSVGKLESDVLEDIEVTRDDDDPSWRYHGKAKVLSDAPEGEHTVRIRCGDHDVDEEFLVIVDERHPVRGGTQVTVYPEGAPETGGGPVGSPVGALGVALTGTGALPARRVTRR